MKRVITAAVLAVFSVSLCVFSRRLTVRETDYIIQSMETIDSALTSGDAEEALHVSETFRSDWESIHDRLCTVLQHDHLDALESAFPVLSHYIRAGESVLASAECKRVITMTEHIERTERVTPENIL